MITDDTETVPQGHWEINSAFTIERVSGARICGIPLLDINYGTSRNTQLKLEIPWIAFKQDGQPSESGIGNTNIGCRWRFLDQGKSSRFSVSMYPQFEFNTSSSSVDKGLVDPGPEFLFPIQWQTESGRFRIGGDFGYRFRRGPSEVIYGIVFGTDLSEKIEVMGEIHGSSPASNLRDSEVVFNFGSRIYLDSRLNFIFSAGRSIRKESDPNFIGYFGLQVQF